jgi:hypothetical protein
MMKRWTFWMLGTFFVAGLAFWGCSGGSPLPPIDEPITGQSDFVSAVGQSGYGGNRAEDGAAPGAGFDEAGQSSAERTVEEGDIYRLLEGSIILNLNAYRGLQVIDFAEPSAPRILGRLRLAGYPVEMYAVDGRAYLLMNHYRAYYGNRGDVQVDPYEGGVVVAVDISDPANPVKTGEARVPGWIMTGRLTRLGSLAALYVAASNWNGTGSTVVRSFALPLDGRVLERTTLDLGGFVADIQATPQALLVARTSYDENWREQRSLVSLIDISDPSGVMIEGAEIRAAGYVRHKTNLDLYRGVLRLVSGSSWSGTDTNHLQTFDVSDIHNPRPVDHDTFGPGEQLYATLFLGNKAFFVTFLRVDPFHAFYIDDAGQATEMNEFVVSGWNDFFKPVLGATRLVGVGVEDDGGSRMAISLYDITELSNPSPLLARAPVETSWGWSEARWDDRAFTVVDGAVSVPAADGSLETGLVLLPFQGWDGASQTYTTGVQIFTFSGSTLTRRGVMEHGTPVRRSFVAAEDTAANLSDLSLAFFDLSEPDAPAELGRLDLAPSYTRFLVYGQHGARLKNDRDFFSYWWGGDASLPDNRVQIIPLDADPDLTEPLAEFPVPANAQIHQLGELLVVTETQWVQSGDGQEYWPETRVQVWDLADPPRPRQAGALVTRDIQPYYGYYRGPWGPMEDCWGCGGYWWGYTQLTSYAAGQALAFPATVWEQEQVGIMHSCSTYPVGGYQEECRTTQDGQRECVYLYGSITCQRLDDGPEECYGEIQRCTTQAEGFQEWVCRSVDPRTIPTETSCNDWPQYRYWSHFDIALLDLRNPDAPVMAPKLTAPVAEEALGLLARGDDLFVSFRVQVDVPGDPRGYARYFFRRIGLTDPSRPAMGPAVNVPGELLDVAGQIVFTRDVNYAGQGTDRLETSVNKLRVQNDRAVLEARVRYRDREVSAVKLDGRGNLLVTHRLAWWLAYQDPNFDWSRMQDTLSVLDAAGSLGELSALAVDSWAGLRDAQAGRALFWVPGGVLVVNLDDPTRPFAQAYFPSLSWYQDMVVSGDSMFLAGGPYGMMRFDLNEVNIEAP